MVDELWEHERHRLQTVARQRHLDKKAARKKQEAAHCQRLLDKRAVNECQEAARKDEATHCQRLLKEEAAHCLMAERAALTRKMVAAQTTFLWLCCRRLHVGLARQTSRRQQHKAALALLQYKQDCCSRAVLAEEQCRQAAAVRAKALANEADERRRQDALAVEQRCRESAERAVAMAEKALAVEQCRQKSAERAAAKAETALAMEQRRRELANHAAAMAENALAMEQCRQESA